MAQVLGLLLIVALSTISADYSGQKIHCKADARYREINGQCNHLHNPLFGSAGSIYSRIFPAHYSDGRSQIRKSVSGADLPSARLVSSTVLTSNIQPQSGLTFFTMQWGQFVAHDIILTEVNNNKGAAIQCCSKPVLGELVSPSPHPECLPTKIATNDPLYNAANTGQPSVNCMNIVRSQFGNKLDGSKPKYREQKNANTHWLDGSLIYGSNIELANSLRDPSSKKGQMKTSKINGHKFMPLGPRCCPNDPSNTCPASVVCFTSGDNRQNQHASLTATQTIWLREHNRVARRLAKHNPGRSDEFYYQEARRIVIAEIQHITYNEYLPTILGRELVKEVMGRRNRRSIEESPLNNSSSRNELDQNGHHHRYSYHHHHRYSYHHHHHHHSKSSTTSSPIITEFSTAAYRFGHSQVTSFIQLFEADGNLSDQSFSLANSLQASGGPFFPDRSGFLNPRFIDNAMRGLTRSLPSKVDRAFAEDVHGKMFRREGSNLGFDLMSLNIQRGRDHGLPTYAAVRGLKSFDDLASTTPADVIAAMKNVYASVFDIDLFVGAVTETPLPGALIGPTAAHIVALQFHNLKYADRFFYDDPSQPHSFTKGELAEIQKMSLARIVCDNNDGTIHTIQRKALKAPEGKNSPVSCSSIPGIDFTKFVAAGRHHHHRGRHHHHK